MTSFVSRREQDHPLSRYLRTLYRHRSLVLALARLELVGRYRRSVVGVAWALLVPLSMTILMSLVLQRLFNQPFRDYSFHVFTGIVVWDFIVKTVLVCATSIVLSGNVIKQVKLPLAIFPIKSFVSLFISFAIALAGCVVWIFVFSQSPFWIFLPVAIFNTAVIAVCLLPVALSSSVLGMLLRDFPQAMQIFLQAFLFLSPVFLLTTAFSGPLLSWWNFFNPVYHLLELVRAPLISGTFPNLANYLMPALYAIVVLLFSCFLFGRYERNAVFYV